MNRASAALPPIKTLVSNLTVVSDNCQAIRGSRSRRVSLPPKIIQAMRSPQILAEYFGSSEGAVTYAALVETTPTATSRATQTAPATARTTQRSTRTPAPMKSRAARA